MASCISEQEIHVVHVVHVHDVHVSMKPSLHVDLYSLYFPFHIEADP